MKEHARDREQAQAYQDSLKLRALVVDLRYEHERIHLPLVNLAAAASALAVNPQHPEFRREAREAWSQMLRVVERHLGQKSDVLLARSAERLNLVSPAMREAVTVACERLSEFARAISSVDLEGASAESVAQAADSMRRFAIALDDLAALEEHELLPKLQRMLFEHVTPVRER